MAEERGDEPTLDAPLEERRELLVNKGSASGMPGEGGTRATDFRVGEGAPSGLEEEEGAGAGTGAAARDAGEEGTPASTEAIPGAGELTDDAQSWSAVGGGRAMTEEGAAAGPLRDERAREEDAESG